MKKTFFKAAAAAAVVAATVALSSVVAFAADALTATKPEGADETKGYMTITQSEDSTTYKYDFQKIVAGVYSQKDNYNVKFEDGKVTELAGTKTNDDKKSLYGLTGEIQKAKTESIWKFSEDNKQIMFTIADGCTAVLTLNCDNPNGSKGIAKTENDDPYPYVTDSKNNVITANKGHTNKTVSYDLTADTYSIKRNKATNLRFENMEIKVKSAGASIQYNLGDKFGDATDASKTETKVVPTETEVDYLDAEEVFAKAESAGEGWRQSDNADTTDKLITGLSNDNVSANEKIKLSTSGSPVCVENNEESGYRFKTVGGDRHISVTLADDEAVMLTGYVSGNNGDASRGLTLKGEETVYAPTNTSDTAKTYLFSSQGAGTYDISSNAGVNFKRISIVKADVESLKVPVITLGNASVEDGKIAYTAKISGDADETLTVNSINFSYAQAANVVASSDAPEAKTVAIEKVAKDGNGYEFKVLVDASKVELIGLKTQASLTYGENDDVFYSNVVEYTPAA